MPKADILVPNFFYSIFSGEQPPNLNLAEVDAHLPTTATELKTHVRLGCHVDRPSPPCHVGLTPFFEYYGAILGDDPLRQSKQGPPARLQRASGSTKCYPGTMPDGKIRMASPASRTF